MKFILITMAVIAVSLPITALAENLIDPTRPADWVLLPEQSEDVAEQTVAVTPIDLSLQAIFSSPTGKRALISGEKFYPGDYIGDMQIIDITLQKVVLKTQDEELRELWLSKSDFKVKSSGPRRQMR